MDPGKEPSCVGVNLESRNGAAERKLDADHRRNFDPDLVTDVTDPSLDAKMRASLQAVDRIVSGMVIGLGTGSTANLAIAEVGRRLASGALRDVVGVATSVATEHCALDHGVPLVTLETHPVLDLTIDGADEVDPRGNLIKGHGGALLREKIVASCSRRLIIIVDRTKLVAALGEKCALPVEVAEFGWSTHLDALRGLGAEPALRVARTGEPFRTDGGHLILDASFAGGIAEPAAVDETLRARPGIIETGLFLGFDPEVIVGDP